MFVYKNQAPPTQFYFVDQCVCFVPSELSCAVVAPLRNAEVKKCGEITLSAVISKPRQVEWFKDGSKINCNERFDVQVSEGGYRHSLTIKNVELNDQGDYFIHVRNRTNDNIISNCILTVKGD